MSFFRFLPLWLAFLATPLHTFAAATSDNANSDPCVASESQPSDISLQLSILNGQAVFREGEIITLKAEYSADSKKRYYLDTRGYDRSGRLTGMEVFCIDPAKGADPLADYFNGIMCFIGGGLGSQHELSREPYVMKLELNEWKSLSPGSYRLRVVSHRVTVPTETSPNGAGTPSIPLQSNEVQFQVVKADLAWQAEQLAAAEKGLDSSDPTGEEARHAARVLRFLGSEAATRELARRFWSGNDQPFGWDLKFGLFGTPYRAAAIEGMKTALKDPQHPVTQELVQTLALLEIQSDPQHQLPKYDEKNKEAWARSRDAHTKAVNDAIERNMLDLATALPNKIGQARTVSTNELLQSDIPLNPAAKAQLRQMLVAGWDSLSVRRQNELIQYRWEEVGGPEFLPVLRHIVSGQPSRFRQIDKPDRESALRRLYEVSPSEGRGLILHEIANGAGDIGIDVLGILPERDLPQIEQPLMAKLRAGNGNDVDYQLLERYAGRRALPQIKVIYDAHRGEWACVPQSAMLRYFLRISPEYGVAQVSDALGQRKLTGCYKFQLTELNDYMRRPKLEQIAIGALNDSSSEVARNAAEALEKCGSRKAEAALWERLEKFHEEWKNKTDELRYGPHVKPALLAEIGLEQVLVQAIVNGQAWFATEDTIRTLRELASPQLHQQLDGLLLDIQRPEQGLTLNWWPEGSLSYSLGRYSGKGMAALKEKLAQFPTGMHFNLITTQAERNRHRAEFTEVSDAAAADGLVLQIQTPR